MRIVNLQEFRELPNDIVFMKFEPCDKTRVFYLRALNENIVWGLKVGLVVGEVEVISAEPI